MVLPVMQYSPKTKTGNEVVLYYNLDVGIVKKHMYFGGFTVEPICGGSSACPPSSFDATVLTTPSMQAFGGFPANSPVFSAVEGEQSPPDAGVFADLICLPNPANDVAFCFDNGFEANPGIPYRAVPRKFNPADHYVRQRSENTLRLTDAYVSNWAGVERIRGRRVTIIAKVFPEGGGAPSEIQYYSNVLLNVTPLTYGNDGNATIEVTGEGSFNSVAVFSALPV